MPFSYKFGKKPAVKTDKVAHFSSVLPALAPPPDNSNWYAEVPYWGMLGNDEVGDCAFAAAMHCLMELSAYAEAPLLPTTEETLAAYSAATGYNPANPYTDQGTVLLGPGSLMSFWQDTGITCGGELNKVSSYMQIQRPNPTEWMQAINVFGGLLIGIQLPETIVAHDEVPFIWGDPSGPIAGGHAVWLCGYQTFSRGRMYDLISWGEHYRATEAFLLGVMDEAVVIYDEAAINSKGLDGAGMSVADLQTAMQSLKNEA